MEQIYRLTGRPLRAVFDWSSKYKQFFDPAGHAWSFVEAAEKRVEPEATTSRRHGRKGSVPTTGMIVPHLVVRDTHEAVAFYERAFGATVLYRSPSPTGNGEHLHLKIWNLLIQVSSEEPAYQRNRVEGALLASPESLNGSTCVFQIGVTDVDAAYWRAVDEGSSPAMPPTNMFWGDRYGWLCDPFGRVWAFSEVLEVLTPEEVQQRMPGFAANMEGIDR